MGTKKDIGKLFKERLGDLEQSPDAGLWDSIASELDKSQSRRIAPLWYYFGGVVIVGILALIWFTAPVVVSNKLEPEVVDVQVNESDNNVTNTILNLKEKKAIEPSVAEEIEVEVEDNATRPNAINKNGNLENITKNNRNVNKTQDSQSGLLAKSKNTSSNASSYSNAVTILNTTQVSKSNSSFTAKGNNGTLVNTLEDFKKVIASQTKSNNAKETAAKAAYIAKTQSEINKTIALQKESARLTMVNRIKKKQDSLIQLREQRIAENKKQTTQNDFPKTPLERANDRKAATEYEIAVSPYTSLLSYGSLTKASSIDDRLVNNPRDAISTVGYGLRVDYTLSEKTSLRLGIGFAPLKYQTDNFQVSIINGNINIYELSAINTNNFNNGNSTENSPQALSFFSTNNVVSIQQNISYIEVPVDFQYRFLNKRVALSISPGVSLFVLNNNEIFATADSGQSIFVGRETNLNGLSLAFNLGLGGHYNINDKWRLNVEPVFRYQLNPYSNNLSNFRPYYVGAQFGMSYKF